MKFWQLVDRPKFLLVSVPKTFEFLQKKYFSPANFRVTTLVSVIKRDFRQGIERTFDLQKFTRGREILPQSSKFLIRFSRLGQGKYPWELCKYLSMDKDFAFENESNPISQ